MAACNPPHDSAQCQHCHPPQITTNDQSEFLDHMRFLCAVLVDTKDGVETWSTVYVGKKVLAGTWNTRTNTGTLDLV